MEKKRPLSLKSLQIVEAQTTVIKRKVSKWKILKEMARIE